MTHCPLSMEMYVLCCCVRCATLRSFSWWVVKKTEQGQGLLSPIFCRSHIVSMLPQARRDSNQISPLPPNLLLIDSFFLLFGIFLSSLAKKRLVEQTCEPSRKSCLGLLFFFWSSSHPCPSSFPALRLASLSASVEKLFGVVKRIRLLPFGSFFPLFLPYRHLCFF